MKRKHSGLENPPTVQQLKEELKRVKYRKQYGRILKNTIYTLLVVAAVAILIATIWMPALQIYGASMEPTLEENDIVVSVKTEDFSSGELVCFYIGNKLLVKRYIAGPGQWVDIDKDGNVYVDGEVLDEPYIKDKAMGEVDVSFPYQIPENRIFVLGDHRSTSQDSRNSMVGCISKEQIVGRIIFRVWPLNKIGKVK